MYYVEKGWNRYNVYADYESSCTKIASFKFKEDAESFCKLRNNEISIANIEYRFNTARYDIFIKLIESSGEMPTEDDLARAMKMLRIE